MWFAYGLLEMFLKWGGKKNPATYPHVLVWGFCVVGTGHAPSLLRPKLNVSVLTRRDWESLEWGGMLWRFLAEAFPTHRESRRFRRDLLHASSESCACVFQHSLNLRKQKKLSWRHLEHFDWDFPLSWERHVQGYCLALGMWPIRYFEKCLALEEDVAPGRIWPCKSRFFFCQSRWKQNLSNRKIPDLGISLNHGFCIHSPFNVPLRTFGEKSCGCNKKGPLDGEPLHLWPWNAWIKQANWVLRTGWGISAIVDCFLLFSAPRWVVSHPCSHNVVCIPILTTWFEWWASTAHMSRWQRQLALRHYFSKSLPHFLVESTPAEWDLVLHGQHQGRVSRDASMDPHNRRDKEGARRTSCMPSRKMMMMMI
jgi:hypothetical protein